MELDYTVVQDSVRELLLEMSGKIGIFWGYGHGTSGLYSYVRNECLIGSDALSNGRMTGFVDTVDNIDDAILDLGCRKKDFRHLSLVFDYIPSSSIYAPIYKSFVSDSGNMARYLSMSDDEHDQFLIDYICKHDVRAANRYSFIIGDRFPVLSAVDKVKRRSYMISHNMFDVNQFSDDVSVGRSVSDKLESVYDKVAQSEFVDDSDGYGFD